MDDLFEGLYDDAGILDSKKITRKIIELYMSNSDNIPEKLRYRFFSWLMMDRNMDVKDEVLMDIFDREVKLSDDDESDGDNILEPELLHH